MKAGILQPPGYKALCQFGLSSYIISSVQVHCFFQTLMKYHLFPRTLLESPNNSDESYFQISIVFIVSNTNATMILFAMCITICCLLQFNFVFSKSVARYFSLLKLPPTFVYTIICIIYSLEIECKVGCQGTGEGNWD